MEDYIVRTYKNLLFQYFLNIVNFLCYGWISASPGGKATPNENQIRNNQTGNPELPRSQEDSDNDYFSDSKR